MCTTILEWILGIYLFIGAFLQILGQFLISSEQKAAEKYTLVSSHRKISNWLGEGFITLRTYKIVVYFLTTLFWLPLVLIPE
jgi:hypothetical protein